MEPSSSTTPEGLGSEDLPVSVSLVLGLQTPIFTGVLGTLIWNLVLH